MRGISSFQRVILILLVIAGSCSITLAQEKKVKSGQIRTTNFISNNKSYNVVCMGKTPGKTRKKGKDIFFTSFKAEEKILKKARKTKSSSARLKLLKLLITEGSKACVYTGGAPSSPGAPGTPPPQGNGPKADHLSLEKYQGPFGFAEAQLLFNRFAFGGTPAQLQVAVNTGLDATLDRMFSLANEPDLEARAADIECDTWLSTDPAAGSANRQCNANNVNDFSRGGLRSALLYRYANSQNPLFHKLAFFLMDERLAVGQSAARDCERHAIRSYLSSVYKASITGDYRRYMQEMNKDQLTHLRWLDGGTNRGGLAVAPNENYAREFWELGTVGTVDLTGKPVYTDLDVANSALALTGWNIDELNVNGNTVCLASYVPLFHTNGPKTIFAGTPYQSTIENSDDLLAATFLHPRVAEHLAEDMWKEFVNPFATPVEIRELAEIIRSNNYNLIPAFRRLMSSKAMYAAQSRNSLIKHPLDLVIGFVKTTGFPLYYRNYDTLMSRLEQQVLVPNTVFGWNERYLSGQQLQIEWWNALIDNFMNVDLEDLKTDYGWSYYDRFVADLHASGKRTSGDVIDRVAKDLGVAITPAQKAELDQMMNFYLTRNGCPGQCGGQPYRLVRNIYDTDPAANESQASWNGQRRLRMLIAALMELPGARTK